MAQVLWSQDFFAKGEISPLMYSRITLNAYYQGLKRAKNVLCLPQGSAGKRFGTTFNFDITAATGVTDYTKIYFKSFQYLNECCYILVFYNNAVAITLEGELIATVATGIFEDVIPLIDHTVLDNRFVVTTGLFAPDQLVRSAGSPDAITGFSAVTNTLTLTALGIVDKFYPARFLTAGTLPTTTPQIHLNKTYFVRYITTTTVRIYSTPQDAANNVNFYTIASAGAASSVTILNTWTWAFVPLRNRPVFDFTGGYDTSAFTPSAQTGYGITLTRTAGAFNFTANYVGGVFVGNGGIGRIVTTNGTNIITIDIVVAYNSLAAIPGTQCFIAEPAWSDLRGWPRKCSSFQNRALFANTDLLPNGFWASVVNDIEDFNDIETNDDNAISWYPSSDTVNFINWIVPYRSLTIHTNSGIFSTPLSIETAITPRNFSLVLQDSTTADRVQPAGLDNQIIVISGNDAHSLLWDGFNNAYTSSIISIANEQLLRTPIDEAPYTDKTRAGSRYMFIVNQNGTLAIYQTLISENVSGFTDAELEQSYGNAYFRAVTSNFDGRAWFVVERELGAADTPRAITAGTGDTWTAAGFAYPTATFTAMTFTTATTMPTTTPQVNSNTTYWAVGVNATQFKAYLTQEDAEAATNPILISSIGVGSLSTAYPLTTKLLIEQLSFDSYLDCAGFYDGVATSVIASQARFNGQDVQMQGDGFGFEDSVTAGDIQFLAHGVATEITEAQYGFPIDVEIVPLPLSISMGSPKSSNLLDTKHLRFVNFLFADTIGGTVTDGNHVTPIAMQTLEQVTPGSPPTPQTGNFEMSLFGGWNDFNRDSFTINHREPFGFKLTGIFYKVDA